PLRCLTPRRVRALLRGGRLCVGTHEAPMVATAGAPSCNWRAREHDQAEGDGGSSDAERGAAMQVGLPQRSGYDDESSASIDTARACFKARTRAQARSHRLPHSGERRAGVISRRNYTDPNSGPARPRGTPFLDARAHMTSGAEAFKAALRRSALLIIVLVALGAAALMALRQVQGPRYQADARVLISNQNLAEAL